MNKVKISIIALVSSLVVSNAIWAFLIIDASITNAYSLQSYNFAKADLSQALRVIPLIAQNSSRQDLITAFRSSSNSQTEDSIEKDGLLWSGNLGFKFNANGKLVEVEAVGFDNK